MEFFTQRTQQRPLRFDIFGNLDSKAKQHIQKVYGTLALALSVASLGVLLYMQYQFNLTFSAIGAFALMIWLYATPQNPYDAAVQQKRLMILCGIALCKGACIAPLVQTAMWVDAGLVLTALACTAVLFICFTAAAAYADRRQYLFLGGALSSAVSMLMLLSLISMFSRSTALFSAQLYLGLLVFCGYVIYDTQMIIESAHASNPDYIMDALHLFIDFVGLFVRILIVLMRNREQKSDRRSNNNNNSRR